MYDNFNESEKVSCKLIYQIFNKMCHEVCATSDTD